MNSIQDIIERLEKATGPDRNIDYDIERSLPFSSRPTPYYTASIDDALTLVPEGWSWQHYDGEMGVYRYVNPGNDRQFYDGGEGDSPAVALCLASLRARASLLGVPAYKEAKSNPHR